MGLIDLKSNLTWPSANHPGNPPAVDFFDNNKSGATGFTNNVDTIPAPIRSRFIGITKLGTQYTYPSSVMAGRLMNPPGSINFPAVKFPGPQNFFDNNKSGATGFTNKVLPIGTAVAKSQFLGLSNDETQYTYPATVMSNRLMQPPATQNPRSTIKYSVSAFPGPQNFFEDKYATGFTTNMYPIGAPKQNSQFLAVSKPDLLTSQYNNPILSLQGEQTPNSYIKQPFILRGIQRPGNKAKPQRWGFGLTFDDGFMRGGIVTATERSLVDVLRLGKWMITPKGLLWNVKQLGLGFANPKVETVTGAGIPQTRLHFGPTTLLSAAGNAFGQHFVSHGLPFVSVLGNYGNVQIAKKLLNTNRLVALKGELFPKPLSILPPALNNGTVFKKLKSLSNSIKQLNPVIGSLSGLGGANSVYGIGRTDIKRYVWSGQENSDADNGVRKQYNINTQYFSIDSQSPYRTSIDVTDTRKEELGQNLSVSNLITYNAGGEPREAKDPKKNKSFDELQGAYLPDGISENESTNFATLAYGKLPKKSTRYGGAAVTKTSQTFDDFRSGITDAKSKPWISPAGKDLPNYAQQNIETAYRIGKEDEYSESTKDFIDFNIGGIKFRAFLDSVSDSFSPTWNVEYDQGRADGRILYGSFARSIGLSFRVAVFRESQTRIVYDKLTALSKLTMPVYGGESFHGRFCNLTVGHLYNAVPVYIDSLTYDWDSESPWILDDGTHVPMYTSVTLNCNWIGTKRPDQEQPVFSLEAKKG